LSEYRDLVQTDHIGDMAYLRRHFPLKENPELLLPGVRSAVVVIKNYKNTAHQHLPQPRKIARYAVGQDYHLVMSQKLDALAGHIRHLDPTVQTYCGVDSRPLAERSLALKAGVGFRGRNTMVIKPKLGSYFFIGIVLTTAVFPEDKPMHFTCGTCRKCIDACPTDALSEDGRLDPLRCISYQTIEQKAPMSGAQRKAAQGWRFGCDICQEVCPFNHSQTPLTDWELFMPEAGVGFDFFEQPEQPEIPKDTALYRSRKQIRENWKRI
jgi:epoxyqueuosine reductase